MSLNISIGLVDLNLHMRRVLCSMSWGSSDLAWRGGLSIRNYLIILHRIVEEVFNTALS